MRKEHEKSVCKAVVDFIARRKGIVIEYIDYPDEKERTKEEVDVLVKASSGEIVLEHTRIESYPKQIEDWSQVRRLLKPLEEILDKQLPMPGHYELAVKVGAAKGAKNTESIQKALIKWIKKQAPALQLGSPEVAPKHYTSGRPEGVPFEVSLYRWPRNDGKFWIVENAPDDLESKRRERIHEALMDKCPKLWKAKEDKRTSILLLESDDICLGNHLSVGKILMDELPLRIDAPDEVYFAGTELETWIVWVLKEGNCIFRDVKDPGPYYLDTESQKS